MMQLKLAADQNAVTTYTKINKELAEINNKIMCINVSMLVV